MSLARPVALALSASTLLFFLTLNPTWLLVVVACTAFMARPLLRGEGGPLVACSRRVSPARAGRDEPITITLTFESATPLTAEVLDELPEGFRVLEGSRHFLLTLGARSRKSVSYVVAGGRLGHFLLERVWVRAVEPDRLREWGVVLSAPALVTVLPSIEGGRGPGRLPPSRILEAGPVASRVAGLGLEFYSLRDYRPGDDFRMIFWRGLAKTGRLYSRLHEAERRLDVVLLVDGTASARRYLEGEVVLASNLAHHLLAAGARVGLLAFSRSYLLLQPDAGMLQLKKIVDACLGLRAEDPHVLEYQLAMARRLARRGSLFLLVSPLLHWPLVRGIVELGEGGRGLLVVAVAAAGEGPPGIEDRVDRLERRNALLLLARRGVPYVEWSPGVRVAPLLGALTRWRP